MRFENDKNPFFVIIRRKDLRLYRHLSYESALQEAIRLTNKFEDKFWVLKTVVKAVPSDEKKLKELQEKLNHLRQVNKALKEQNKELVNILKEGTNELNTLHE